MAADRMPDGHGHVIPRPDGRKARCAGPTGCQVCAGEALAERLRLADAAPRPVAARSDLGPTFRAPPGT